MALTRRRVTSVAALKALAHPVRLALLDVLMSEGPLTASQAAVRVGTSPSNCSWHLRHLAQHGFVREAPGVGGRGRPWRAVSEGLVWDDAPAPTPPGDPARDPAHDPADRAAPPATVPADRAASEALTDMLVDREVQRLRAARAARDTEPPEWQRASGLLRSQLWLTADEAAVLHEDLVSLLERHGERAGDPARRPDGARLVSLVSWLAPSGPQRPGSRP